MKYTDEWNNMTGLYIDLATSGTLSVDEAVEKLAEESYLRTVWETVRRYSGLDDMDDKTLRSTLADLLVVTDPASKPDSVRKTVSNWSADGKYEIDPKSALKLAFALELPPRDAEEMIVRLCGEGFHWRDPNDIVMIYGLNNGLKYYEAQALLRRMIDKGLARDPDEEKKKKKEKKAKKDAAGKREQTEQKLVEGYVAKAKSDMTELVSADVEMLQTEEELESFLTEAGDRLGELRNKAYTLFIEYMNLLKQPAPKKEEKSNKSKKKKKKPKGKDGEEEEKKEEKKEEEEKKEGEKEEEEEDSTMSVDAIMRTYMFEKYIPRGKEGTAELVQSALQKAVQRYWPDPATLSKMRTRKADVTRKALILLFLACDGGESAYGDLSEEPTEDVFQDMYMRLDGMLIDCGFAPLDARSPFDWMVLYCMCQDRFLIDEKMNHFLEGIFPPVSREGDALADDEDDE